MQLSARLRGAIALAGQYPLLAGVDLDVREGEILVVRGANGAGKTSLLRVLAGLLPLSSGDAFVLGLEPLQDARELRPLVGLLGHRNGLYDDLTAEQNVRFAVAAARLPRARASLALERLGLSGQARALPAGKLSAGQRRRVALASLLARQPRLWLLDEPHAGLDAEHRRLLDELLREVCSEGATVVLASHEEYLWEALATRTVTMAGGTVLDGLLESWLPGGEDAARAVEVTNVA
ncbi:MAG TPA: heme ABC exporter ATP-binding protein CcmA [Acidimicrobiales bacterium]|nr:heme ABC exporter ATP-binding protein CcmA [Acidimicrobiales bacterium]